ncbi:MAG: alpha/beta hydrolase, partial [Lysobacteraceae bacterium]
RPCGHALWLAGFSFGAWVALRGAAALDAAALISIAPPVARGWDFADINLPAIPWLVVQGEADEIVDAGAVFAWLATLARQPQLVKMPDTSHFFHRKLIDLRGAVKHGVHGWLPVPPAA